SLGNHDRFFNDRSGTHNPLHRTDSRDRRLIYSKVMAADFQRGGTRYRRDRLLEGSQDVNVRRPAGPRSQHPPSYSGYAEHGSEWPLERMGADQRAIEPEWYNHLALGME